MDPKHLLSVDEVADHLRILPRRLTRLVKADAIPYVALPDGELRFDVGDLDAWVERHKRPAAEARNA